MALVRVCALRLTIWETQLSAMAYAQRLQEAGNNPQKLRALADDLRYDTCSDAQSTRLRAIKLAMEVSKRPQAVSTWLQDLGLPPIDGRALYRYRLSDESFAKLGADLKQRRVELAAATSPIQAAKFVLWSSEWFRRHYNGSVRSWEAVTEPLGFRATQPVYRELADAGLRHWRIPKLRINGTHYRLAAVARQGGFPLAAVEASSGWAHRFLERLVGLLLNQPKQTFEVAERAVAVLIGEVPPTWQSREMQIVSAELALAVVCLRRAAEQEGASGQLVSAWLDRNRPAWRDELPLSATSAAGRALMDGLMKAPALRGGLTDIGARRVLRFTSGGGHCEQVELDLSGSITDRLHGESGQQLAVEWSRLRLRAGDRVLSRPCYVHGAPAAPHSSASPLATAMAIREPDTRRAALLAVIDAAIETPATDGSYFIFRTLIEITLSLAGLPPATFDALSLISQRPALGAALLFFALPGEVEVLMRVVEGLPTAWWLIPKFVWDQVAQARWNYLDSKLPGALPLIARDIGDRRRAIASEDPVLEPLLNQPYAKRTLADAANAFLNQVGDRPGYQRSPFRAHMDALLPTWKYDEQFWRPLDAPVAAALAASGARSPLTMEEIMCAKDVARRHPRWFREGFAAALQPVKP